jgi:hypothetical protein
MRSAAAGHFGLDSVSQKERLTGLLMHRSGFRELLGMLNFPGVVEHSTEFDYADVTCNTESLELEQKSIGGLTDQLSVTD